MNRHEAINKVKEWLAVEAINGALPGDTLAGELQDVVAALSGPTPDLDTGLLPCGCGGMAVVEDWEWENNSEPWQVYCEDCHVGTRFYASNTRACEAWNLAMSGVVISKMEKTTEGAK